MRGDCRRAISGCLVALAATLVLGAGAASAQTSLPATTAVNGGPDLPRAVVAAMLSGTPDAFAELKRYLAADDLMPGEIADRAIALINALGQQAGALKPDDVARTMDRITVFASRLLANASVIKFAIDGSYRPAAGSVALDFGPASAPTQPGFAKVTPNDTRLSGDRLAGLQRPHEQTPMASGIAGIRKISLNVPKGDYRLVLMTQRVGDPALSESPFGRSLRVNGVPVLVRDPGPAKWIGGAVLTDRGAQLAGAERTVDGFLAGRLHPEADGLIARQQGGALVIDMRAANGAVEIEMSEFGDARSYITGLLLEPKTRDSHLVLQGAAVQAILPLDTRLALEARILAAAAAVLEQVTPAAGPNPNAPAPAFESPDAVSSS